MSNFGFLATPTSLTFTTLEGKTVTITSTHENFVKAKELVKEVQGFIKIGLEDTTSVSHRIEELENLVAPVKKILASGEIEINNGVLYYDGKELNTTLTQRIIWGIGEGFEMTPYISFLKNLMLNPSYRSVDQLFTFIERHKMGISDDGFILGYKRVGNDFKDLYTRTMDNSPGQVVKMTRNQVSDDPNSTCSAGLHFCAMDYLASYGAGGGNKIVIVKINPKDVVSVPVDHDAAKVRCCEYLVLSEYNGADKEDLLGSKPIFTSSEWTGGMTETVIVTFNDGLNDDETTETDESSSSSWWSSSSSSSSSEEEEPEVVEPIVEPVEPQEHWADYLRPDVTATASEPSPVVPEAVLGLSGKRDSADTIADLLKGR